MSEGHDFCLGLHIPISLLDMDLGEVGVDIGADYCVASESKPCYREDWLEQPTAHVELTWGTGALPRGEHLWLQSSLGESERDPNFSAALKGESCVQCSFFRRIVHAKKMAGLAELFQMQSVKTPSWCVYFKHTPILLVTFTIFKDAS